MKFTPAADTCTRTSPPAGTWARGAASLTTVTPVKSIDGVTVIAASVGATGLMLLTTLLFAFAVNAITDLGLQPLILAYSPGGLAEMSLIALALGIETAFVATHHVIRIGLIVISAPLLFRLFERWRGRAP